jgi:hypothetical protein
MVKYNMSNVSDISGIHLAEDARKDRKPHNLTPEEDVEFVMNHINSFPRVPSHYCRKDSTREYLGSELNLAIMYRLYVAKCQEEDRCPVGDTLYRSLFADHEPSLSFYSPKKDQCPVCNVHKRFVKDGLVIKNQEEEIASEQ